MLFLGTHRVVAAVVLVVKNVAIQLDFPPAGAIVVNLFAAIEPADVNRWLQSASNYTVHLHVAAVRHVPYLFAH